MSNFETRWRRAMVHASIAATCVLLALAAFIDLTS